MQARASVESRGSSTSSTRLMPSEITGLALRERTEWGLLLLLLRLEKRRRRTAKLEESSELEPSKKMFSWIRVLAWKGERREESFWWDAESGSRSLTSTSMDLMG